MITLLRRTAQERGDGDEDVAEEVRAG